MDLSKMKKTFICFALLMVCHLSAMAQSCYSSSISSPTPFLGNGGEMITLSDGTRWIDTSYLYLYLYEYYPTVTICPSTGRMTVGSRTLSVTALLGCHDTTISSPNPFMGNGGEMITLLDGTRWKDMDYQLLLLLELLPTVTICPNSGKMYDGNHVFNVRAQLGCYDVSITNPTPFLGNGQETITLSNGTQWKDTDYQYLYLYEYYPTVTICPSEGKMYDGNHTFNISQVGGSVVITVPGAPTIGVATPSNGSASIAFTAPTNTGGSTITGYTATCNSQTGTGTTSPITVTGLTNGIAYSCSVTATNATGTSASSATVSVTPATQALPDLVVTSLSADTSAVLGGSFAVSGTISNQGTAAAGASRTKLFLSTDSTITTSDIDTTYGCDTAALAAGVSATCSGLIPLPASLSAGTYYVGMISDANNQVVESNESNNARAATTTLQVSAAIANQTITFGSAPSITVGGTGTISATATSSLAVTFSSTTTGVCTVSGSIVTGVSAGTCTIAADQAGNSSYAATPQVSRSISITSSASSSITLSTGWNLVGNSVNAPLTVATTFGDTAKVFSVWKWNSTTSKWAFYTPAQTDGGAAYAASKSYDVLTTINGGEAFWVNAETAFTAPLPSGTAITSTSFQGMTSGWHLISFGSTRTPSAFNTDLSMSPPAAGVVPQNITTLWAWDNAQSKWYFYAPSLEAQGGTALTGYIGNHGYLDFTAANKVLGPGVGFWVYKP